MSRILIAEDERDIRELIEITLQFHGHEVVGVEDGQLAIEVAAEQSFDLILLDVRMPSMNGYEACRLLRNNKRTSDTPIVFLSAKGQESEVEHGLQLGATDYILKPFSPDELSNRVMAIIEAGPRHV